MAPSVEGMTITTVPDGYHTVTPWLINEDAAGLIDFILDVFEGEDLGRVEHEGRIGHAEVRVGDSVIMLFDAKPEWPKTPGYLRLYVADDAGVLERAVARGGRVHTRPTEMFWGDRVSRMRDPFGNLWWIHQRVAAPDETEMMRRMEQPEFQRAMEYVQSRDFFADAR
jgi:PhnB protein